MADSSPQKPQRFKTSRPSADGVDAADESTGGASAGQGGPETAVGGGMAAASGKTGRRRWPFIVGSAVVVCAVAGATITSLTVAGGTDQASETVQAKLPTAAVTRGDVTVKTLTQGTIAYEGQRVLLGGPAGTVTSLPAAGTVISPGQPLYAVNAKPVTLMSGEMPAWRDFAPGMEAGADVRQLNQNLVAFGVLSGAVTDKFTPRTEKALRVWQKASGVPVTGTLARADLLFLATPVRVAGAKAQIGQQVGEGTEILAVSSTTKTVTVDLKATQQALARTDAPVSITLPTGKDVAGTVAAVGAPVVRATGDKDGSQSTVVPVTVKVTDQGATGDFENAGVQVLFSTASSKDVLTVPVEALVPLDDSHFGVEIPDTKAASGLRRIPVTAGTFGAGRVEVRGAGIAEGTNVVVPSSVSGS